MKKILLFSLLCFSSVFAAANRDIEVANFLASQGIIDNHANNPALYNLSSPILRQEMVGMALRMMKIPLPNSYFCRDYFADVRYNKQNNWVCRAIEIAADHGIISNKNGTVRPLDSLTRSEALGIILKSGGIDYPRNVPRSGADASLAQWQVDAINGGTLHKIIYSSQWFGANTRATRMDVFGMLYNLLLAQKIPTGQGQQITLDAAPEAPNISNTPDNTPPPPVLDAAPEKALWGFIITLPPKPAVGSPTNVTITAVDEVGNIFTTYTGTIYLDLANQASTDMSTPLDENGYTFTTADTGTHTFAGSFFFKKAGVYTFDIFELDMPGDGVSQSVTVTAQ